MRSCIYCGRDLKDGEVCNCPGAQARRNAKEASGNSSEQKYTQQNTQSQAERNTNKSHKYNNSYQTGYVRNDGPFKRARDKFYARATANRNGGAPQGHFWGDLWRFIKRFIAAPIETIQNPGYISMGTAIVISMITGAIINLCLYFMLTGAVRSTFGIILSVITINTMEGYANFLYICLSLISGSVSRILICYIYSGIFMFINRFMFRRNTPFRDFAPRLSLTVIPVALASVIGILFGTLSSTTLAILVICGLIGMVILTYEALRTEWISYSSGRTMYSMMLGMFVFTAIICYIIRLS